MSSITREHVLESLRAVIKSCPVPDIPPGVVTKSDIEEQIKASGKALTKYSYTKTVRKLREAGWQQVRIALPRGGYSIGYLPPKIHRPNP